MKIETQPRDDHQVRMVTEIEPELLEKHKHIAARKISQEQKIPGFRPGKAPFPIVLRYAGEEAVEQKAIDLLLDEVYPKAIEEAGLKPFGPGSLEEIVSKDPLTFAFVIPLEPEVDLGDYREVRQEYTPPVIDDARTDEFIERLRSSYGTMSPVERPAGQGDVVFLTLDGHTVPAEGEEPSALAENRSMQATIPTDEETNAGEWPYPGFARELTGLSAGEEKTLAHHFSEESPYEELRGKHAEFHVHVQAVKENELPEVNVDFAQQVGQFETVDELREAVRKSLEADSLEEYEAGYFNQVIDKIQAQAKLKYPPQAVDEEAHSVLHNIEADLARQKMDLPTYLKLRKLEEAQFIEQEVRPAAVRRLERSLLLNEISKKEELKLDESMFESQYRRTLMELQGQVDLQKMQKKGNERLANAIAMEAVNRTMNRQVLARLKKIAGGIEETTIGSEPAVSEAEPATEDKGDQPEDAAAGTA